MLDPEIVDLWVRTVMGDKMSPEEDHRLMQLCFMLIYTLQNNWEAGTIEVMDQDWKRISTMVEEFFSQ